jgi:hypothetical protein
MRKVRSAFFIWTACADPFAAQRDFLFPYVLRILFMAYLLRRSPRHHGEPKTLKRFWRRDEPRPTESPSQSPWDSRCDASAPPSGTSRLFVHSEVPHSSDLCGALLQSRRRRAIVAAVQRANILRIRPRHLLRPNISCPRRFRACPTGPCANGSTGWAGVSGRSSKAKDRMIVTVVSPPRRLHHAVIEVEHDP